MKKLTLIAFLFSGCGGAPFIEPASDSSSLVAKAPAPIDCSALCVRATDQLMRDFAVPRSEIHCGSPNFVDAHDCKSCNAAFTQAFSVTLSSCPF